jgi:serine/threonine protein phosphatase PrpC
MGNAPLPPSAAFISEQPTVQFPPNSNGDGSATTAKHQQSIAEQETVENLQQLHGRNLSLTVGTRSDPGIKRKHKPNEDSLFAMQGARTHNSEPQQFGLFVVADGMGGHANGQDASRRAIQTIIDFMLPRVTSSEPMDDNAFLQLMNDGVQNANQAVHDRNAELRADMGTTMTAALVVGATAYVANVGDSRTYLYREGQGLSKVTNDHSVVASLVEAGIIQPDDIYTHPKRNQIYRSLGEKEMVEVDTFTVELQPGDKLLLCSDGLWDMVRDPLIQQVLSKPASDPNKTGQELIKAALEGGGEDNVSVIVAQFAELNTRTGLTGVQLLAKPETVTVPDLPPI